MQIVERVTDAHPYTEGASKMLKWWLINGMVPASTVLAPYRWMLTYR